MGISVDTFLKKCHEIELARPVYQLGHDGSDGGCDCIGLIIGSIRRSGGKWDGTHGSNYAARNEVTGLQPINQLTLQPGDVVLKGKADGLPDTYRNHPDRTNYYHIGVVMNAAPLDIMHCTTYSGVSGIVHDHKIGNWGYQAKLKKVDSTTIIKEENPMANFIVTAANGKPVYFRKAPNTTSGFYELLPVGTEVEMINQGESWSKIKHGGETGYMMTKFLDPKPVQEEPVVDAAPVEVPVIGNGNLEERVATLEAIVHDLVQKISDNHPNVSWG